MFGAEYNSTVFEVDIVQPLIKCMLINELYLINSWLINRPAALAQLGDVVAYII